MKTEGFYKADGDMLLHGPNFVLNAAYEVHKGQAVPAAAQAAGWDLYADEKEFRAEANLPWPAWVQPLGAHDAYPAGEIVAHAGRDWESLLDANVWEPGVSGWREYVPAGGPPPEWVQPTGAHDAYNIGDRVTFQGAVYESLINGNVWSPAVYPAGWLLIP
jgi:hypothetical protein